MDTNLHGISFTRRKNISHVCTRVIYIIRKFLFFIFFEREKVFHLHIFYIVAERSKNSKAFFTKKNIILVKLGIKKAHFTLMYGAFYIHYLRTRESGNVFR